MPDTIMINYQNMDKLSSKFQEARLKIRKMHEFLGDVKQGLEQGWWLSEAATKFYKDFDTTLAGLKRLENGLNTADEAVNRIALVFRQAEENGKQGIPNPP